MKKKRGKKQQFVCGELGLARAKSCNSGGWKVPFQHTHRRLPRSSRLTLWSGCGLDTKLGEGQTASTLEYCSPFPQSQSFKIRFRCHRLHTLSFRSQLTLISLT